MLPPKRGFTAPIQHTSQTLSVLLHVMETPSRGCWDCEGVRRTPRTSDQPSLKVG